MVSNRVNPCWSIEVNVFSSPDRIFSPEELTLYACSPVDSPQKTVQIIGEVWLRNHHDLQENLGSINQTDPQMVQIVS